MKLKKISICGFKSIADSLKVEFGAGVTCIVGPNGCGKSNVSDAVRWVLGEQNPRELRANRMQDLIFSGTESRKPEAMAEVRLLLDNEDGTLGLAFTEVEVTRRLYRSGDSEYRINKEVVRLKDVADLFANTGIGTDSYSLLGQGRVDSILSAKPSERRELFDEAAGITRYRNRQEETQRKLKRVDADLQRVYDIMGELTRQVRSLKIQAGRAERHRGLLQELHEYELRRIHHLYQRVLSDQERNQAEFAQARDLKSSLDEELIRQQELLVQARSGVTSVREALNAQHKQRHTIEADIRQHDQQLNYCRQMEEELQQQGQRTLELRENLQNEKAQLEATIAQKEAAEKKLLQMKAELENEESLLAAQEAEGVRETSQAHQLVEQTAQGLRQAESRFEAVQRQLEAVQKEIGLLGGREEKIRTETEQAVHELDQLDHQLSQSQSDQVSTRQELESIEQQRDTIRAAIEQLEQQIEQARSNNENLRLERSRLRHRLESLAELQQQHEGYRDGVKSALSARDQGQSPFDRIETLVIENVRVDSGYADAIESALAKWLEAVICPSSTDAIEILQTLQQSGSGRVRCLSLDLLANQPEDHREAWTGWQETPGALLAANLVTVNDNCQKLLQPLLSRTVIVENLESLASLARSLPSGWIAVTRQGEVAEQPALLAGGRADTTGYLRRQSEIESLQQKLQQVELAWQESENLLERLHTERKEMQEQHRQKEQAIQQLVVAIAARQQELQGLTNLRKQIERNLRLFEEDLEQIQKQREEGFQKKVALEEEATGLQSDLERNHQDHDLKRQEWRRLEEALQTLRQRHGQHREGCISVQKDLELCKYEIQEAQKRIQHLVQRLEQLSTEESQRADKLQDSAVKKQQAEDALRELIQKFDTIETDIQETEANLAQVEEKFSQQEAQLQQVQDMLQAQVEKIQNLEMARHRIELDQENLNRRLNEELKATWEEAENVAKEFADQPLDQEHLSEVITSIREKISKIGDINPLALEEFEEQSKRLEFLTTQQDDLEKTRQSLLRTISEVKRTARARFMDTFEQIRRNFYRVFRKVFGGGRADLLLLDESDELNSGIEIVAQPPGKKQQSITLFSGGEKSMTAIALLFAIYQVKASPFCFLDEVDAALDDANVDRFARLLMDYRNQTQFIIVTHNKHTMAAADRIYGVTMEKPGVSSMMAIEFERRGEYNLSPLPEVEDGDDFIERSYDETPEPTEQVSDESDSTEETQSENETVEVGS